MAMSTSSASGRTDTVAVEVWIRPEDSVTGTRCTRWTPDSNFRREKAASPAHLGDDLLEATGLRLGGGEQLDLPAPPLRVSGVHPEQVAGKQRGLVAAGTGPHLDDDVAIVVRIRRYQVPSQLGLELRRASLEASDLVTRHLAHALVGVVGHRPGSGQLVEHDAPLAEARHHRVEAGELPAQLGHAPRVGCDIRAGQESPDLAVACLELGETVDHAPAEAMASRSDAMHDSSDAMLTSSMARSGGRVVSDWSHRPGV